MVDAGMMPGPRVFATGPGVFSSSGIEDRDAAFRFLKRYKEAYRTNTIKQYVAGDRLVRQWIIEASHDYGITPTIEGSLDLKLNLTQIADGYTGQEHSFPIMPLHKDVVEFVARTKTFYTPTILVAYGAPWSENHWFETENTVGDAKLNRWIPNELLDTMIRRRPQWFVPEEYGHTKLGKQVADIVHAGGRAGLGSHGQLQGLGAHWETWNLRLGRADAARDAEGRHHVRRRGARPAAGRRLARGRQARRPGRPRRQPAGQPPQHQHAALRDEERRAVRGRHAQRRLAGGEDAAAAVLVGHRAAEAEDFRASDGPSQGGSAMRIRLAILLVLGGALPVLAQEPAEILIRNGLIVTETGRLQADLRIRGGEIAEIARNLTPARGARTVDATGKLVLPGGHRHPRAPEPGADAGHPPGRRRFRVGFARSARRRDHDDRCVHRPEPGRARSHRPSPRPPTPRAGPRSRTRSSISRSAIQRSSRPPTSRCSGSVASRPRSSCAGWPSSSASRTT